MLAPALGAWGAFLLGREISRHWLAALAGGFLFGFSAPEYIEMQSELNLDTIFLIPLAVLLCVRRVRGSLVPKPFILLLTLLLVLQIGISSEGLATLCLMGALAWMIFLVSAPAHGRTKMLMLARDIAISAPLVILLASPFLYYLLQGLPDVPDVINSPFIGSSDLVNFLVPGSSAHSWQAMMRAIANEFSGFRPDEDIYIGIPLLLLLVLYFSPRMRLPYVRALFITALLISILSLGPRLHFNGQITSVALPWALAMHLPLVRSILPARLVTYLTLCTAMAATHWLAETRSAVPRVLRFALAGLACFILVPVKPVNLPPPWKPVAFLSSQHYFSWSPWPTQNFFTPQHIRQALGPGANVLLLPSLETDPGIAWQLDADMQFTQSGGYVGFVPLSETHWGVIGYGPAGPGFGKDFTIYCAAHRVNGVLIGPGTPSSLIAAIHALNWPRKMNDGVEIVHVPDLSKLKYRFTQGDYWPSATSLNWMGKRMTIISHNDPAAIILSGNGRPSRRAVRITVASSSSRTVYKIGPLTKQTIVLPATGSLVITASETFVPDRILHNGDQRNLSVLLSVQPNKNP